MAPVLRSLMAASLLLAACAPAPYATKPERSAAAVQDPAVPDLDYVLWTPCTREQAERWAQPEQTEAAAGLRAAGCYTWLALNEAEAEQRLAAAVRGRQSAEAVKRLVPNSGLAHYLSGYLAGLEAENAPLRGLELVSVIESEALIAARLTPAIDLGGPDRMLGSLYLRAPAFPISVGDTGKAAEHFRRAASIAPDSVENHLGLAEALLAEDERIEACAALHRGIARLPSTAGTSNSQKAAELLARLCASWDEE